jgi:hypothetical protein
LDVSVTLIKRFLGERVIPEPDMISSTNKSTGDENSKKEKQISIE